MALNRVAESNLSGYVYLLRHRQGPVAINSTNKITEKLIKRQLPATRVPKASRTHDWNLLCVARTPDEFSAEALKFYLHELRRKRDRLYESNKDLAHAWYHYKFPKRHAATFEAVSDLANALEYLYKQPPGPRPDYSDRKYTQPVDVRRPTGETTVFWQYDWFKGKESLWPENVVHHRLPVVGLGGDVVEAIRKFESRANSDGLLNLYE